MPPNYKGPHSKGTSNSNLYSTQLFFNEKEYLLSSKQMETLMGHILMHSFLQVMSTYIGM